MSKLPLEIRIHKDPELGEYKAIFVGGILFDWGMPKEELDKAVKLFGNDPFLKKSVHGDIQRYFLESFGEFIGREVTINEVNEAIEAGSVECCW